MTKESTKRKYPKTGVKASSSGYRRKELCQNDATDMASNHPRKILAKVIRKRLSLAVDLKLREEQAGFRRGRGYIDHVFTFLLILPRSSIVYSGTASGGGS